MVKITKIISSAIKNGRRILKILRLGKEDIQTSFESMPYGVDSVPVKDLIAIQMETSEKGKSVVVGYINKNQAASVGEIRIYATDTNGVEKGFVHLKNDGVITANGTEIQLNGSTDNVVKFIPLDAGLQSQAGLVNTNLTQIAAILNTLLPGSYVPTPVVVNIAGSKVVTVKVP